MPNRTGRLRRAGALAGLVLLVATLAGGAHAQPSYTVRWGDTLTAIAARYGTTVPALASLNGIDPTNILLSGTTLSLPADGGGAAGGHLVRRGETLSGIAARYGTTVSALVRANGLASPHLVVAGTRLSISGSAAPSAPPSAETATSGSIAGVIDYWSGYYGVDSRLVRALAWMESGYQADITSHAGAWGVMQVTPSAWAFVEDVLVGASIPRTADGNVRVGVAYLAHLLAQVGGDERLALGAYYQGLAGVRARGLLPETRRYVADVLALKSRV